ncbi:TPA: Rop family plasmid primer RNA-binding protein [Shigella flexneri]|nr:Rop family plasmid primer RNA-binding protein [Shigella flexneri]
MTKQEKTALNMARFIRSQTLTLLEKLNELDADEQADICESLYDHADELYRSCLARFGDDGENRRRACQRVLAGVGAQP